MNSQSLQLLEQKKARQEKIARITAAKHLTQSHFSKHEKIEGFHEDRQAEEFFGCDRLMKLDSLYGTIQMGYDPKRRQSFLFANIKTSIFDTAASREQREMDERRQMRELKTGNQNRAFTSRRRENTAVMLYKAENKPWSPASVAPYLSRVNTGALAKTMPFLQPEEEYSQRDQLRRQQKELQEKEMHHGEEDLREIRAQRLDIMRAQEETESLIHRKEHQSLWFFRRVNLIFDLQKQKMFEYYKNRERERAEEAENAAAAPPAEDENKDKS